MCFKRKDTVYREDVINTTNKMLFACDTKSLDDYRDLLVACFEVLPSAQPEQAVKDCRTCKHGKYNDYHDTYFCYNAEDCSNWDKWETSAQPEQPDIIRCRDCKHWEGENHGRFWYFEQCSLNQHVASCDDFCSYAERR